MIKRLSFMAVLFFGLCLSCYLGKLGYAQTCGPSSLVSWITNKPRDSQGLVHVTVNYSGGNDAPTATMKSLMQSAVAEWNTHSCQTGVVFSEVTSSATVEFVYTTNENDTKGCAAYVPSNQRIYQWSESAESFN